MMKDSQAAPNITRGCWTSADDIPLTSLMVPGADRAEVTDDACNHIKKPSASGSGTSSLSCTPRLSRNAWAKNLVGVWNRNHDCAERGGNRLQELPHLSSCSSTTPGRSLTLRTDHTR